MKNTNTNDVLKSLETLYTQAKYGEAIDLLLKNKTAFDVGLFHYNLGSLYLKNKNLPIARFHLEKAYFLGVQNDEILNNLKFAQSGLELQVLESSGNNVTDTYYQTLFLPGTYMISYLLIVSIIILWIKKWKKYPWSLVAIFWLFLLVPLVAKYFLQQNLNQAVVLNATHSKEGPSAIFENNHEIPAGLKIIVTKPKEGWYFIKHPSHLSGWIKNVDLGIL